jgi:hypothetical protein
MNPFLALMHLRYFDHRHPAGGGPGSAPAAVVQTAGSPRSRARFSF